MFADVKKRVNCVCYFPERDWLGRGSRQPIRERVCCSDRPDSPPAARRHEFETQCAAGLHAQVDQRGVRARACVCVRA